MDFTTPPNAAVAVGDRLCLGDCDELDRHDLLNIIQAMARPTRQHQGEPIMLTAVATLVDDGDGCLAPSWLLEGGTAELFAGMTLLVADNAPDMCSEDGSAQVYTHADPAEVERLRNDLDECDGDRWKLRTERNTLRAQLAEAHAVLRLIPRRSTPYDSNIDAVLSASAEPSALASFQARVQPWLMQCFGEMISGDREERNHRFLEEALELVQALGATAEEAHQLVDYVFGRAVGEPAQEVGGVMVTLAALCLANGLDMYQLAETELARIWTKVDAIRAKQASKPQFGPLPGVYPDRKP